jgi:3-oxoadipate enol-lactonase
VIALAGDISIGYDDVGTGIPVVLLHAFPHNRTMWAPQLGALLEHCRCIAPDTRGFGESSEYPPYSMERFADDLAELLDFLALDQAVIGGLSMGGYIALAFYRRHRKRVRALILADTRAGADNNDARARRAELITLAEEQGPDAVADKQLVGLLGPATRQGNPDLVEGVRQALTDAQVPGIRGALEAMMARQDSTPLLAQIDVPTLVIVGEDDALTPVKEARALHSGIRGSRLEVIPGAGHLSNLERPAAFTHLLSEFIGALNYT